MRGRALLWSLAVPVTVYLIGYFALTWPLMLSFGSAFYCDAGDGYQNVWNLWWVKKAIVDQGRLPWFTDQLFWPEGVTLIGHTLNPWNGLCGIVLAPFLTPIQVFNTLVVAAFVLGGLGCFLLAWRLSRCYRGSLFAGAAFTFSHFHFAHAVGHMQLVSLQWIPFFLLALLRLIERPSVTRGAVAALCLFLVALCDWYYTFYCVVMGAAMLLREAVVRRDAVFGLRRAARAGFLTFFTLSAASSGWLAVALIVSDSRDPLLLAHDAREMGMDLLAPFVPGGAWRFSAWTEGVWKRHELDWVEGSTYLGWVPLCAAIAGLTLVPRERRRGAWLWAGIGLASFLLALGPRLHAFGTYHDAVSMPYTWLEAVFPPLRLSGMPVRMAIVMLLCTALLAANGFVPLLQRVVRSRVLQLLVLLLFGLEIVPRPGVTTSQPVPETVQRLAELPTGAVHGWMLGPFEKTGALWHQTIHEKPVTWGYVSREPTSRAGRLATLQGLEAEKRFSDLMREYQVRYLVRPAADTSAELREQCRLLWKGFAHAIWVAPEDPLLRDAEFLSALSGPRVAAMVAGEGTVVARIESPRDGLAPFVLLASAQRSPATELGAYFGVDLAADEIFTAALLDEREVFKGNHGRLDSRGRAEVMIVLPDSLRARLKELHLAAAVLEPGGSHAVHRLGSVVTLALR